MATQTPFPSPYPETKPATEFINGQLVQKMSPRALHGRTEGRFFAALDAWANEHGTGRVSAEWDFDLTPPGERTHRLVPDVAYLSYERISYEDEESAQIPAVAPSVAVEVLSPGQTMNDMAEKVRIFLAAGCELVIVIDPREEYALLHDGTPVRRIERDQPLTHAALPHFSIILAPLFVRAEPKR
jgi:Uma2 family endonuclease